MDPVLYSSSLIGFGWRKLKRKFNVNQRMQNRIWNQRRIYGHHQTGGQNEGGGPPKTHFVYFSNGCLPPQSSRVPPDGCWSNVECYWRLGGKTEPEVECHPVVSAESWLCWKVHWTWVYDPVVCSSCVTSGESATTETAEVLGSRGGGSRERRPAAGAPGSEKPYKLGCKWMGSKQLRLHRELS